MGLDSLDSAGGILGAFRISEFDVFSYQRIVKNTKNLISYGGLLVLYPKVFC